MISKSESENEFRLMLVKNGNLTPDEIEELIAFEFYRETKSLDLSDQVRRYYLKVKSDNVARANEMMSEIGSVSFGEKEAMRCLSVIRKYLRGTMLYADGQVIK